MSLPSPCDLFEGDVLPTSGNAAVRRVGLGLGSGRSNIVFADGDGVEGTYRCRAQLP